MAASAFMAASGLAVILIVTDAPGFNNKKKDCQKSAQYKHFESV